VIVAATTGRNSVFQLDEIPFAFFTFFYALTLSGYTEGSRATKSMPSFMNRKRVILLNWGKSMAIWWLRLGNVPIFIYMSGIMNRKKGGFSEARKAVQVSPTYAV
jgi:hypothetical protein